MSKYRFFRRHPGEGTPMILAIVLVLLILFCTVAEFSRVWIIAQGVKEASQQAVISTINDNYDDVYHAVREGYAAGWYELTHYMDEHYSFNITLQTLSTIACMSESKMKKLFKSVYNMSITEYIQRKRISVAEHMLIQTDLTIAEISRIVGYSNPSRLIEIFKRYYGFTPSKYRK